MQGKSLIRQARVPPSLGWVHNGGTSRGCYLVEWYQSFLLSKPIGEVVAQLDRAVEVEARGPARLMVTLTSPTDEVVYGVFTADSADTVSRICRRAGWPADRITEDVVAQIAESP